jgi:SAM-dependent methyltransferase
MFFADPALALSRMRAAVRPGGRLVLAAWGAHARNPFLAWPAEALDEAGIAPAQEVPGARTAFEFETPGHLLELAAAAGWHASREEFLAIELPLDDVTPAGLLPRRAEMSQQVAARIETADPARVARARHLLADRVAGFVRGEGLCLPGEILLVTGAA